MTNKVSSVQRGKKILVTAPYNPDANARFRELGGKFDRGTKSWTFPNLVKEELAETLMDHYFEDGFLPVRRGVVKIKANHSFGCTHTPIRFAGRILGRAKSRDGGARISDGVNVLSGSLTSGGSVKNWETRIAEDSVLAVHDMPESIMEFYEKDPDRKAFPHDDEEDNDFEILEFIPDEDEEYEAEKEVEDLDEDEKKGLLQRVSDLESRLATMEVIIARMAA